MYSAKRSWALRTHAFASSQAAESGQQGEPATRYHRTHIQEADLERSAQAFWVLDQATGVGEERSASTGKDGKEEDHGNKTAYGSCVTVPVFLILLLCVTFCCSIPSLFAKYLKTFRRGSELLTNLGKMLWKTLSTKTDLYS